MRASRAVRRVLAEQWDLVHVHRVAGFGAGLLRVDRRAGRLHRARLRARRHQHDAASPRDGGGAAAARCSGCAPAIVNRAIATTHLIYPSARLREKHLRWGLRPRGSASELPHGWRLGTGSEPAPAPVAEDDPVVFLFLGKLIDTKGIDLLLEAWGDGIPGAELWIAGSGPREAAVDAAAAAGRIRKLGWLDETARSTALRPHRRS